jgi:hypothetical protein
MKLIMRTIKTAFVLCDREREPKETTTPSESQLVPQARLTRDKTPTPPSLSSTPSTSKLMVEQKTVNLQGYRIDFSLILEF